jgi:DNA-binding MarR family transcriptional regulator
MFDEAADEADPLAPALSRYTGYLLTRAFVRARAVGKSVMPPGRHPQEMSILATLRETGPISQRKLGDMLGVNRTIMVKIVDRLETDGLVRRERDPADRRSYALAPTQDGLAALARMHKAAGTGEAEITERLTGDEARRLTELLLGLLPDTVTPPTDLRERLGYLLAANHVRLLNQAREALAPLGLEPRQFGAMSVLAGVEPCSQQRLAAEMRVTGPAIVGLVDYLYETGRIERARNPDDRRAHVLRLTAKGRTDLSAARRIIEDIQAGLADRIGADGLAELNTLLAKIGLGARN